MDPRALAARLFESPSRGFLVELWDGTALPPSSDPGLHGRVVLRSARALESFLPPASERRLAEAIIDGAIDLVGDAAGLVEAASRWEGPRVGVALVPALASLLVRRALLDGRARPAAARLRGRVHSADRDAKAIRHHYDVSDELYSLFLDPALVYSCAYFARGDESIDEAQRAKLDLVCRKLALAPGERLLDVGCGWGALLVHAASRYGADGLGVTVSENQLAEARRQLAAAVPGRRVAVARLDYRAIPADPPFHKVASIGMMEHVGRAKLDAYFRAIHRVLVPGGLFLNHAIAPLRTGVTQLPWASQRGGGFIERHIFPDGDLVPIGEVVSAAERAGFEVRDVESLREHYAETLAAWLARLEARFDEAVELVGERKARAYRLYLAASEVGFRTARTGVFQLLLAKRTANGRCEGLPRCRSEWYPDGMVLAASRRDPAAAERAAGRVGAESAP
jgi:cyclopropane-fatty-acyl-phospholipid synthase